MRPATPELARKLLATELDNSMGAAMENGLSAEVVLGALAEATANMQRVKAAAEAVPPIGGAKERIAAIRAACTHVWSGVGAEGLGGYSEYECALCGQPAGVGGVLR